MNKPNKDFNNLAAVDLAKIKSVFPNNFYNRKAHN